MLKTFYGKLLGIAQNVLELYVDRQKDKKGTWSIIERLLIICLSLFFENLV